MTKQLFICLWVYSKNKTTLFHETFWVERNNCDKRPPDRVMAIFKSLLEIIIISKTLGVSLPTKDLFLGMKA